MKVWTVALTVLLAAAMLGGCGLFQSKEKEQPDTTRSAMAEPDTWNEPAMMTPPAESYVEPARPWGSETRDNLERP